MLRFRHAKTLELCRERLGYQRQIDEKKVARGRLTVGTTFLAQLIIEQLEERTVDSYGTTLGHTSRVEFASVRRT